MASANINRLMDNARINLPGALDSGLQLELFAVLDEFFQTSSAWTEDIEIAVVPVDGNPVTNPDGFTYDLIPSQGSIVRIMGITDDELHNIAGTMAEPGRLLLQMSPDKARTIIVRVALTVKDPVTREGYPQFPDWILDKYSSTILDGLLGRMMAQIAKPYTSQSTAVARMRAFKNGASSAKVEAARKNMYRAQNWSFPQSFNRRKHGKN